MKIFTTYKKIQFGRWPRVPPLVLSAWNFLAVLVLTTSLAISQWSSDPGVNNIISNDSSEQVNATSISDGSGGAIITWQDLRSGTYDIYAQRVDSRGNVQWTSNGVVICSADSDQVNAQIISDGSGGAIISWEDKRNGSYDIYAQRVNSSGALLWSPSTGDSVCVVVFDQTNLAMVSDGNGGALLAWEDYRSNAGPGLADIYTQKINATGVAQWDANGIGVCTQAAAQHGPKIISDGSGGAILTWYDQRAGDYDIYAQRVTIIGGLIGIADGVAVCTSGTDQTNPDICSDGVDGAIIVWQDFRSTTSIDIWVQRMSPSVSIIWPTNGVVMNNNVAYDQINPKIVSDGTSGALMTWEDFRTGTTSDIYAQRVDVTGVVATGWNVNGVAICVSAGNQYQVNIVSDSSNGAILTWVDNRDSATNGGVSDVYASRITGAFALPWSADGVPISIADSTQTHPTITSDGSGGAIIAWQDKRSGNYDIYASQVSGTGVTSIGNDGIEPTGFNLAQNYPNPFNPTTKIEYSIEKAGMVSLKVYNVLGLEVATLVDGHQEAGGHAISFGTRDGNLNLSSGVYYYRLEAGFFISTKKLIFIK